MMPSATVLAHQLRTLSEDIDCHVAAQLWIAVRTFPWRTTGPVAANLNRNLRKKVLQDLVPTSSPIPPTATMSSRTTRYRTRSRN